jgi:hypothetical protein
VIRKDSKQGIKWGIFKQFKGHKESKDLNWEGKNKIGTENGGREQVNTGEIKE